MSRRRPDRPWRPDRARRPLWRRVPCGCAVAMAVGTLMCCGGAVTGYFGFGTNGAGAAGGVCTVASSVGASPPDVPPWTKTQVGYAITIVTVGQDMGVPTRGWIVAVATAMQESSLHNYTSATDHDSLGLFQQRPSQGWGTPAQVTDPVYAATQFYTHLLKVKDWQDLPLTKAAQAVQRSAYPDAYAKWEPDATQLVGAIIAAGYTGTGTAADTCGLDDGDNADPAGSVALPNGYRLPADTPPPIVTAIQWALQQIGTPYHFGGSCTDPHSGVPAKECDCSSLTQQSYKHGGVTIPRLAAQQAEAGTPLYDLDALKPGDLLFLVGADGTREHPGHVGMYLGGGDIIEAPHTGTDVRLTTLADWRSGIVAARRIVAWPADG